MNRISQLFQTLQRRNEKALIAYITAGDPTFDRSLELIDAALQAGVDLLELGIPFSDPTADGTVIQEASGRALANGMTLSRAFELVEAIRLRHPQVPIVLFSYYNPLLKRGAALLEQRCREVGVDGLLVVDLPPEEAAELTEQFQNPQALPLIRLIAPTTHAQRKQQLSQTAEGFLYLITRTGVTGKGSFDLGLIARHSTELRQHSQLPICLGFGISSADDVRLLAPYGDGVIVGSALMQTVADHQQSPDLPQRIAQQVRQLKSALL